jgi:hypothetical protein
VFEASKDEILDIETNQKELSKDKEEQINSSSNPEAV